MTKKRFREIFKPQPRHAHVSLEAMASASANPKLAAGLKKSPLRLVPPTLLPYVGVVMTVGKTKYTAYNWRSTEISRLVYLEAILRHTLAALDGEDIDEETGTYHEASIAACAAIALDALTTGRIIDDRYKTGTMGKLLKDTARLAAEAQARVETAIAERKAAEERVKKPTRREMTRAKHYLATGRRR